MPSNVKAQLNTVVRAQITAAEINGGSFPFAAVTIQNTGDQITLVYGLVAQVAINGTDVNASNQFTVFGQRNLQPFSGQAWTSLLNRDEEVLYYQVQAPNLDTILAEHYTRGVPLQPGNNYAFIIGLLPAAVFANNCDLYINVLGVQGPTDQLQFPYILR